MSQLFSSIWFISYKFLSSGSKSKNKYISITSIFAILGIILGVAALIVVMSVMNGYRQELIRITTGVSGHVLVRSGPLGIFDYPDLSQKIITNKKDPNILDITPYIEKQVMLSSFSETTGSLVRGVEYSALYKKDMISKNIVSGNLRKFKEDQDSAVIGESLAINLGVSVGDEIKIITSVTNNTMMGKIPRFKTVTVAAIFSSGSYIYDNGLVFIHIDLAQQLFRLYKSVTHLEISLKDPFMSGKYTHIISDRINKRYYVDDWVHQNSNILSALDIEKTVMFVILTLIVLVAAMNIISSLYMLVYDKKYDIAILRTIGYNKKQIILIFMLMGTGVGFIGTIFGLLLGILFANNINDIKEFLEGFTDVSIFDPVIYYLNNLPSKVDYGDSFSIAAFSVILSLLATIIPAIKACSISPADALRND